MAGKGALIVMLITCYCLSVYQHYLTRLKRNIIIISDISEESEIWRTKENASWISLAKQKKLVRQTRPSGNGAKMKKFFHLLLLLAGDIESNPGPVQHCQICQIAEETVQKIVSAADLYFCHNASWTGKHSTEKGTTTYEEIEMTISDENSPNSDPLFKININIRFLSHNQSTDNHLTELRNPAGNTGNHQIQQIQNVINPMTPKIMPMAADFKSISSPVETSTNDLCHHTILPVDINPDEKVMYYCGSNDFAHNNTRIIASNHSGIQGSLYTTSVHQLEVQYTV